MRKRKFVCGILTLCLALSAAGCGKDSKEQQAANYYQNELGLDKEDAEELAHELYGKDEEEPSVPEEVPQETVVEPLPELVNSEWYNRKVQIYDMVFTGDEYLTEEVIRKIVEGSAYDVELPEDFDENGDICLRDLMVDGKKVAQFWKQSRDYNPDHRDEPSDLVRCGLLDDGYFYAISYGDVFGESENKWYDKASIEFEDLKTRDDVLAYLAENDFAEVEEKQAAYALFFAKSYEWYMIIDPDSLPAKFAEFADLPHYYCKGVQRITLYRPHKLSETDQEVEVQYYGVHHCSGAHLNLVNTVTFDFNTDGTISKVTSWDMRRFMMPGEWID